MSAGKAMLCKNFVAAAAVLLGAANASGGEPVCHQISREISRLTDVQRTLQRSFWTPENQLAAIGATSFTYAAIPSVLYLAASGAERIGDKHRGVELQQQIDALRRASAEADCYTVPLYPQ